jgi:putative copper export protein
MTTLVQVPSGRVALRWLIAPLLVGLPTALIVLGTLGALQEQQIPGLPVVPWQTLWALPIDLWIRDLAIAVTLGAALVGGVLAPRPDPWLGRVASLAAVVWLVTLLAQSVLTVSEVLALPLTQSGDVGIVWSLLTQTTLGRVMLTQFAIITVVALLAWVVLDRLTGILIFLATVVAAFLPGFVGHSGLAEGHESATISLGIHIVAAGTWVGGLIATVAYVRRGAPDGSVVLRRFSAVALGCVILLAESGLLNAALRLDGPAALLTSQYGAIILAKVAVLTVLIGFGLRHRSAMQRSMADGHTVLGRFITWEIGWMGVVLGLSLALSRTAPPGVIVAGDVMGMGSLALLGIALPAALYWSVRPRIANRPSPLRAYPEALAIVTLVAMTSVGVLSASGSVPPQLLAVLAIVFLPLVGWFFIRADVLAVHPWGLAVMVVGLPIATWWVERGIAGGLGAGTWLTILLVLGILVAQRWRPALRRQPEVAA